tara:strand:+ start:212 stop:685 length:474 start_codon:yes stop_codon:yes gene_type:complete
MNKIKQIEGQATVLKKMEVGIICSRFNHFIVDKLEAGCLDALNRHSEGRIEVTIFRTPGAFELPLVASKAAKTARFSAIIALGAVIRGDTAHFELVANSCAQGLSKAALETGVPVIFGVLTVDTIEQAIERAGTKAGNKGYEAGVTAIEMISLLEQV